MTNIPSSAPPISPLAIPGAVVGGKYRLGSVIGYGGMGSVWSATHVGVEREVAIKLIALQYAKSADVRRRFDTEAKAVASLKSRHVVQVYDNGELADGTPFIAMELLRGESLHGRVHKRGPMALPDAVKVITQVCRALTKAHAVGIVHRDIKPENIFLARSDDDDDEIVKVLDFGIAKLSATGSQSATQTGALLGTPLYMSPEQARGLRTIDQRTDIYSLGLVAYTMLTGNLAFASESFGDLLLQICTKPLPSLVANAPWLPETLDGWFAKVCAREPQDRFASAQELAEGFAAAAGASVPRLSSEQRLDPAPRGTAFAATGHAPQGFVATGNAPPPRGSAPLPPLVTASSPQGFGQPSLVSPMTMSGPLRSGPGLAVILLAFGGVALLAVVLVVGFRWASVRQDARAGSSAASSSAATPPPAPAASATLPPTEPDDPRTPPIVATVPNASASAPPQPWRPRPPSQGATKPTGKPKVDLGY